MSTKQRSPRFLVLSALIVTTFVPEIAASDDTWSMPTTPEPTPRRAQRDPTPAPPGASSYGYRTPAAQPEAPAPADVRYYYAPPPPPQPAADEAIEEQPSPPSFDVTAGTVAPLSLGGQATLELPARLLLQLDAGWMPPGYAAAINGMVQAFGGYDSAIGSLVNGALDDAVVVRASAGWRPFPSAGFEIYAGYTHISLNGSVAAADVAEVVGGDLEALVAAQQIGDVELSSRLHNFHVALGWRWIAWDHLVIRALVGYTQTLGSSSSVEVAGHPELDEVANPVVDEQLHAIFVEYVKLPMLGLSAGYRF
jgi:hypothetical protein